MFRINYLFMLLAVVLPAAITAQSSYEYSWRYYRPGNTGIQGDYATALWIDANGDPYIAANTGGWGEGGFAKFDVSENRWINYSNVDYLALGSFDNGDVQIMDIVEDYGGNLWMGNFKGAMKFNPEAGISSVENFEAGNSALNGFTYDIDLAPDSSLWFTSGGLVKYDPGSGQWNSWPSAASRIAVQPVPDGSYRVWSAEPYYGMVFIYNSTTGQVTEHMPEVVGDVAGLPGKDCVDDAGNLWALRLAANGDWETLEYMKPDGTWVYPTPPYQNISFYIDVFKAYGNGKALLVASTGETWMFDGSAWQNYGLWRPDQFNYGVEADAAGNVWVCGIGGAARRDHITGEWQRYRITNTSQIDYFVEDITIDTEGKVWMTGNAGSGYGGFQMFDGTRWTGFNEYTYGLGNPFPFMADNTQAIYSRPSNGDVIFNPTFNGIYGWDGTSYYPLEDLLTTSGGFVEDSQNRLWSLEEYGGLRYYNGTLNSWTSVPLTGWGNRLIQDPVLPGNVWAATDYQILRTDGVNSFSRTIDDFPGSSTWFTGFAADNQGMVWVGTWLQFTSTGSTLIRLNTNTGDYQTWSYDEGWPFPGEHVRPLTITPDGLLWMQYDSEYPSTDAGILCYDGVNVTAFPSAPGGIPQWGGLPNSTIREVEVKQKTTGYELWMSCMGRGVAVLDVITDPVGIQINQKQVAGNGLSVYPNPAGESAEFEFAAARSGRAVLSVFDMQGREMAVLLDETIDAGQHRVPWNCSSNGQRLLPGMYIARLDKAGKSEFTKIIIR